MKTYYHATEKKHVFSIFRHGIKADFQGYVYLSDTVDGALEFMSIRGKEALYAVLPVYLDESKVKVSFDHNPQYIKANAFIHEGTITPDQIERNLVNIPLFKLSYK